MYIARQILKAKFQDMSWLMACPPKNYLYNHDSVTSLRRKEALHGKYFWIMYAQSLGLKEYARRSGHFLNKVLDACSNFVSGIFLRWIHYHHLSPFHGFLHETSDYPALVYDLIEPYRSIIDRSVWEVFHTSGEVELLERSIQSIKQKLKEQVYCPQTKQVVARQELYHGMVLSLRSYLVGESQRFTIPREGCMNGGRPQKHPWRMYGRQAGMTRVYISGGKVCYK
jgi:CRISPR/Cas system-associated endonuclease Cas1